MAEIALDAGFKYGSQLPETVYYPLYFADLDWKNPNRTTYMESLKKHRPHMATVLDLERREQLINILDWASEAALYVDVVIIVPKVQGIISEIPKKVTGGEIRLGYSVPTQYGGTELPIWEFSGWPIHLLGGSPQAQMNVSQYLDVKSVDGNMAGKMAQSFCQFWVRGNARYASNRWWPTLKEANNGKDWIGDNAHLEAFRRSCRNIVSFWKNTYR